MKNMSLTRSIPYWLLLVLSLASAAAGGFLVMDNISTMQKTLLDGTATNVEVYVGQAWITAGAALLAAGVIGLVLALALSAVKALLPAAAPVVAEPIDWAADIPGASAAESVEESTAVEEPTTEALEDQNGSSGSIATATNSNVR